MFVNVNIFSFCVLPQFSGLYLVSLVVILIGFIAFNVVPTPTNLTNPSSSSSLSEEGCYDNPVATDSDFTQREVAAGIPAEAKGEEDEEELRQDWWEENERKTSASWSSQRVNDDELADECSTKL